MIKLTNILRRRLRSNKGVASLEMIIVIPIWLVAVSLLLNMCFFLGTAMMARSALNKAALQTSALGCFAKGTREQLARGSQGLGGGAPVINVRYQPTLSKKNPVFDDEAMFDDDGRAVGGAIVPICPENGSTITQVPGRYYMVVQIEYQQRLWLFGERTVVLNTVTTSQSLNGENE